MNRQIIQFTTESAWKAERVKDLTSSDIPILFGQGYSGYDELFESKRSGKELPITPNERMDWGVALQDSIAQEFARRNKWTIKKKSEYIRIPELRIGSSFDFEIAGTENTLLEIKNVSTESYKGWIRGFEIQMSPYIELQVQHQMLVSGYKYCIVGALIAGCQGILIQRQANEKIQSAILRKCEEFWRRIDEVHDN